MTHQTGIGNDMLEVYDDVRSMVPALFVRAQLLILLALFILGASLPGALAMSDGKFPGKGSKAAWEKANVYSEEGNRLDGQKKYAQAIELFKKAIATYPDDSMFHYNLGSTYSRMNDFANAQKYFEKAVVIEPGYYKAWYNMGVNEYHAKNYEKSRKSLMKARSLATTDKQKANIEWYLDEMTNKFKKKAWQVQS